MAKNKFDGILEAVRLDQDDQLVLAKIYEKRGVIWSDHFLVKRDELIKRLKNGQVFLIGTRQYKLGSSFVTTDAIQLTKNNGQEFIRLDQDNKDSDLLQGIPRF
jgi:hypothetical protein